MNEQDELRDRAARLAYVVEANNYGGYDWETAKAGVGDGVDRIEFGVPADELDMAYEIADGIIALVEQDVARRLLSGGRDVIAKWLPPRTDKHDPMWDMIDIEDMARDIAAAIGITVEDDQP